MRRYSMDDEKIKYKGIQPGTWEYFDTYDLHEIGNPECPGCLGHSKVCECGGLIHSHIIADYGEPYQNYYVWRCDVCGKHGEY